MNSIPMDNLDNGFTPYGLWGGLNDVMRNRDVSLGGLATTRLPMVISEATPILIQEPAGKEYKQVSAMLYPTAIMITGS
jgi:hypothetical protein